MLTNSINRCLNTAFRSAGLRATASRNGERCFLLRLQLLRLPSTLRPPPRRITPVRLRIPWDLLGCRSSERDTRIFFFFSSLFFGGWCRFCIKFVARFLAQFLHSFLGRELSRSWRAVFWVQFFGSFFRYFQFRSRVCFCCFLLSLFDDTHIRLLKTIRTSGLEGRG